MRTWFLLTLCAAALAQDEPGGASDDPAAVAAPAPAAPVEPASPPAVDAETVANEEILVWGERVGHARAQLEHDLLLYGYRLRTTRDGTKVYGRTGRDRWKPKVLILESGALMFRDPFIVVEPIAVRVEASETSTSAPGMVSNASGQPDRGSISIGFPIRIPKQKLQDQEKARVMEVIAPDLRELNAALAGEGEAKLLSELPSRLDRLWAEGVGWEGKSYPDAAARKAALLELYATRADTRAGQAARSMIVDFLTEVVQSSPTPLTESELARARELGVPL